MLLFPIISVYQMEGVYSSTIRLPRYCAERTRQPSISAKTEIANKLIVGYVA